VRKSILAVVACLSFGAAMASPALAEQPTITQAASPAVNHVDKPTVIDLGKFGKYRVTNTTLNGQPALRATKITTKAHAAAPYLHLANADWLCYAWNNQSASDNIHYVQDANGWPRYDIANTLWDWQRYSNTYLHVGHEWHEWAPSYPLLAIQYGCAVSGSDEAMTMVAVGGTSVYWRYS
jgi:hypothetical protein